MELCALHPSTSKAGYHTPLWDLITLGKSVPNDTKIISGEGANCILHGVDDCQDYVDPYAHETLETLLGKSDLGRPIVCLQRCARMAYALSMLFVFIIQATAHITMISSSFQIRPLISLRGGLLRSVRVPRRRQATFH